jgi:hypothetical protein
MNLAFQNYFGNSECEHWTKENDECREFDIISDKLNVDPGDTISLC